MADALRHADASADGVDCARDARARARSRGARARDLDPRPASDGARTWWRRFVSGISSKPATESFGSRSRPNCHIDAEFDHLGVSAVMQDNNRAAHTAATEVFGCGNQDCSVHLQRNCEKLLKGAHKRRLEEEDTQLELFQRDFNRIKNLPSVALASICCYLFCLAWEPKQKKLVKYFEKHASIMIWTRSQCGPGCGSDNNPLEATNRAQKEAADWKRQALSQFGKWLSGWLGHKARDDYGFNERFNSTIWNNNTFSLVKRWLADDVRAARAQRRSGRPVFDHASVRPLVLCCAPPQLKSAIIEGKLNGETVHLLPGPRLSTELAKAEGGEASRLQYVDTAERFLAVMRNEPSEVMSAIEADLQLNHLRDVLNLSEAFGMLSIAHYNEQLEKTLWRMMGVGSMEACRSKLMKCTCGSYMHYLVCEHVIYWHMLKEQMAVPSTFKMVDHVNKGQKFGTGVAGYPIHMRQIPKGAALSSQY